MFFARLPTWYGQIGSSHKHLNHVSVRNGDKVESNVSRNVDILFLVLTKDVRWCKAMCWILFCFQANKTMCWKSFWILSNSFGVHNIPFDVRFFVLLRMLGRYRILHIFFGSRECALKIDPKTLKCNDETLLFCRKNHFKIKPNTCKKTNNSSLLDNPNLHNLLGWKTLFSDWNQFYNQTFCFPKIMHPESQNVFSVILFNIMVLFQKRTLLALGFFHIFHGFFEFLHETCVFHVCICSLHVRTTVSPIFHLQLIDNKTAPTTLIDKICVAGVFCWQVGRPHFFIWKKNTSTIAMTKFKSHGFFSRSHPLSQLSFDDVIERLPWGWCQGPGSLVVFPGDGLLSLWFHYLQQN